MTRRSRIRLLGLTALFALVATTLLLMTSGRFTPDEAVSVEPMPADRTEVAADTPTVASFPEPIVEKDEPSDTIGIGPEPTVTLVPGKLVIPVAGIEPDQLQDTYNDARSEERVHNAIDIIAPRGTPVLAAAEGRIVKLFQSEQGGITLYQISADSTLIYYYAHLDRYADEIYEGRPVRAGETIGYVGDTGNATPGNYHLHFAIWTITDPKHYWEGEDINPYPLLRDGVVARPGT